MKKFKTIEEVIQYYIGSKDNPLNGLTFKDISNILGIKESTLYRKMSGESDFTRNEIQLFREKLGLTAEETDNIFFA